MFKKSKKDKKDKKKVKKVFCDTCKFRFEVKPQTESVEEDVKRVYFKCPHCGRKYVAYYTSNEVERLQKELNRLAAVATFIHSEKNISEISVEYLEIKNRLSELIDELKLKYK